MKNNTFTFIRTPLRMLKFFYCQNMLNFAKIRGSSSCFMVRGHRLNGKTEDHHRICSECTSIKQDLDHQNGL